MLEDKISLIVSLIVLSIVIPYGFTQGINQPCTNPRGEPGRCVLLRDCRPLLEIFQKPQVSLPESQFFYGSRCSAMSDGKPLVCCPMNSKELPLPTDCGQSIDDRIFGGSETLLGEFGWMALLVYTNARGAKSQRCGGSLINTRYVVTAAHCIPAKSSNLKLTGVRLGEHNISNVGPDCDLHSCADIPVELGIEKVILHEEYNGTMKGHYNDIALIRLDRDVGYSNYIEPICLPIEETVRRMNHTGRKAFAAGWGLKESYEPSDVKRKVTLDVEDSQACGQTYSRHFKVRESQLCAGGRDKGKDTCRGDSGGPLMRKIDGNFYQIGVVSMGPIRCGTEGRPGLYTNVAMFIDWIRSNLE